MNRLIFDVESVGLHGEAFAVGWVILDEHGDWVERGSVACPIDAARGAQEDREWVRANVTLPANHAQVGSPREVRNWFWNVLQGVKGTGGEIWTDCGWPVEANFLSACIADDPERRKWMGPYPLLDVANVLLAAGMDPLGTYPREHHELPAHNPLTDAAQSGRMLLEALARIAKAEVIGIPGPGSHGGES